MHAQVSGENEEEGRYNVIMSVKLRICMKQTYHRSILSNNNENLEQTLINLKYFLIHPYTIIFP